MPAPLLNGISLSQYAAVQAGLAEGIPLDAVLEIEGIVPSCWLDAEDAWSDHLLADLEQDGTLQETFDEYLAEAQDRHGRRVPPLDDDLASWLDFVRHWSADPEPLALLARLGLKPGDLIRLHRAWSRRIALDPALAQEAQELLQREIGELPSPRPEPMALPPPRVFGPPATTDPIAEQERLAAAPASTGDDPPLEDGEPPLFMNLPHQRDEAPPPMAAAPPEIDSLPELPAPGVAPPVWVALTEPERPEETLAPVTSPIHGVSGSEPVLPFHPAPASAPPVTKPIPPGQPRAALPFKEVWTPSLAEQPVRTEEDETQMSSTLPGAGMLDPRGPIMPFAPLPPDPDMEVTVPVARGIGDPGASAGETLETAVIGPALPFIRQTKVEVSLIASAEAPHQDPEATLLSSGPKPILMLSQYASLCAELAAMPGSSEQTFARYGLAALRDRLMLDLGWQERLRLNPAEYAEWQRLYQHYHRYWSEQAKLGTR